MAKGFELFMDEEPELAKAYGGMVMQVAKASARDQKTQELAYLAVLSAVGMTGGLGFHVTSLKKLGATREEVRSAVLVGLPAVGMTAIEALGAALAAACLRNPLSSYSLPRSPGWLHGGATGC